MTDTTPPPPGAPDPAPDPATAPEPDSPPLALLTRFAPVPRLQNRRDGWGPDVQRAFIEALADCGSVEQACRFVGRTPASAYRLRRHPEGAEFAAAWQLAVDLGIRLIEDCAIDRAVHGVEVPVFAYGDQVATRRVHNESLVMFMLRNRLAGRYAADGARGLSAVDRHRLARLKQAWREEWERERLERDAGQDEAARESLDRFLETMRSNCLANMSPAQRAAEIAARAQGLPDAAAGWRPGGAYREYAEEAARLLPQFIAEVEKDWPPLPTWAWDEPDEDDAADDTPALPPPARKAKAGPGEPGATEGADAQG